MTDLPTSTAAGIVTAVASLITAFGGVVLAVSVLIPILRQTRATARQTMETGRQVEVVHTIVNQQRTDAQRYQIALTELLHKHGIEVPVDQSLPVLGRPDARPGQPGQPGQPDHPTGSSLDPRPPAP